MIKFNCRSLMGEVMIVARQEWGVERVQHCQLQAGAAHGRFHRNSIDFLGGSHPMLTNQPPKYVTIYVHIDTQLSTGCYMLWSNLSKRVSYSPKTHFWLVHTTPYATLPDDLAVVLRART